MKTVLAFVAALAGAQAFAPATAPLSVQTSALKAGASYDELVDIETGYSIVSV